MKVEINDTRNSADVGEFPHVGVIPGHGLTVLFTSPKKGVVLATGASSWEVGTYFESWAMSQFEPFHGSVTLSND